MSPRAYGAVQDVMDGRPVDLFGEVAFPGKTEEVPVTVSEYVPVRSKPWPSWPVWDEAERANLLAVLDSGNWGGDLERGAAPSSVNAEFEAALSSMAGVAHTVTCCNGSVGLEVALAALGVRAGDEAIRPRKLSSPRRRRCLRSTHCPYSRTSTLPPLA